MRATDSTTQQPRCNCESSYCDHAPAGCQQAPEGRWTMDYVGAVCDACAAKAVATGGGSYIHPLHRQAKAPAGPSYVIRDGKTVDTYTHEELEL